VRRGVIPTALLPMLILAAPAAARAAAPTAPAGDVALNAYAAQVGASVRWNPQTEQGFVVWSGHAWQAYPVATANLPGETRANAVVISGTLYLPQAVLQAAMPPAPPPAAPTPETAMAASPGIAPAAFAQLAAVLQGAMGDPYLWGGTTPQGFDCSGLVQWAFAQIGVDLPRTSFAQFASGVSVPQPAPGDLVFFQTYAPGASHVGVYMGNDQFIDVGMTVVQVEDFSAPYWTSRYLGARQVL